MRRRLAALLMLALAAACGSDGPAGPGDGGKLTNGFFRATVSGSSFNALAANVLEASTGTGGTILSIGAGGANNTAMGMAWIDEGVGTYTINQSLGANATYTQPGGQGWLASAGSAGSGSITITLRTANRVAGTFNFVLVPVGGSATGTLAITNGSFDLTF